MARLTQEKKDLIMADFHTGQYGQHILAKKHKVSTATINKMVRGLTPKNEQKVNTVIEAHKGLIGQSEKEVNAVFTIYEEKKAQVEFFLSSAMDNQRLANKALKSVSEKKTVDDKDLYAIDSHSKITQRNKDTVLGKSPETVINNANTQAITEIKVVFEDAN